MAILSELLVCVLCLLIWFGGAVLVVGLLCLIFGADKIAATVEKFGQWFGLDD